jgi:hypothetical protein
MLALPFRFGWWEIEIANSKERREEEKRLRKHLSGIVSKLSKEYPWNMAFPPFATVVSIVMPVGSSNRRSWIQDHIPPVFTHLCVYSVEEWWGKWPKYIPSVTKTAYVTSVEEFSKDEAVGTTWEPSTDLPYFIFPCTSSDEAKQCVWMVLVYLSHHGIWNEPGNPPRFSIGLTSMFDSVWNTLPDRWKLYLHSCEHTATVSVEKNGYKIQTSKTLASKVVKLHFTR